MWQIVPQETRKGVVLVKNVKFFPVKNKRTGEISFGRLLNPCRRLIYRHDSSSDEWVIIKGKNGFKITCPPRRVSVGLPWHNEFKIVPGRAFGGNASIEGLSFNGLCRELTAQCGEEFANRVCGLFKG